MRRRFVKNDFKYNLCRLNLISLYLGFKPDIEFKGQLGSLWAQVQTSRTTQIKRKIKKTKYQIRIFNFYYFYLIQDRKN